MSKLDLTNVTLVCADSINPKRALQALRICMHFANFSNVKLFTKKGFGAESVEVIPVQVESIFDYSKFILHNLLSYANTDFVLVVQWDGFILNPTSWNTCFFDYDYIGAPWPYLTENTVGNGGFSLRSRKLLKILQGPEFLEISDKSEDHCLGRIWHKQLQALDIKFAPESVAKNFSTEYNLRFRDQNPTNWQPSTWNNQFGFHSSQVDLSRWQSPEGFTIPEDLFD